MMMNRRELLKLSAVGIGVTASMGCSNQSKLTPIGKTLLPSVTGSNNQSSKVFNIRQFGAVGDGVTKDTASIQTAIDTCTAAGGGTVWVPAGKYHIATIELKSNVTLSLDYGAEILGSQNIKDYRTDMAPSREGFIQCLIYAYQATNIAIEGLGTIDGRGTPEAFPKWSEKRDANNKRTRPDRPRLVCFKECQNVTFSGATFKRPAFWGLVLVDCVNCHFNGIIVRFAHNGQNNDGLDIDGCNKILIENCDIQSGDDGVCLKSSAYHQCKNITVRNCRISSHTSTLKFGTSSQGGFANITVTNCYFYNSPMGAIKLQIVDGGHLDNVEISRITMENVGNPIFIRLGDRGRNYSRQNDTGTDVENVGAKEPTGTLKNIYIHDLQATVTGEDPSRSGAIMITGIPGHSVENILLENIEISYPGGGTLEDSKRVIAEDEERYPEQYFFGKLPAWGAFIRHGKNISFNNVNLSTRSADARPRLYKEDIDGFTES